MIFNVGVVIVHGEPGGDPAPDTWTSSIREILTKRAFDRHHVEISFVSVVPQRTEEISAVVRRLIENDLVHWIIVVGGIGFGRKDCTPEVNDSFSRRRHP